MGMHPRLGGGSAAGLEEQGGSHKEEGGFPFQELNQDLFELLEKAY
jgi:hypothetical protein